MQEMFVVHAPFDRVNPYQRALGIALGELGVSVVFQPLHWNLLTTMRGANIMHIHWTSSLVNNPSWKFAFGYPWIATQLLLLRLTGRRIVWTVHNVENHEKCHLWQDKLVSLLVGKLANTVIVHGDTARTKVRDTFGISWSKIAVIPHGSYIGQYPNTITRAEARRELAIAGRAKVLLFLGNIRPYKGVEELIETFQQSRDGDAVMLIAGRPIDVECEKRIRSLVAKDSRIRFHAGFVEDERVQTFMQAADAVVLPYKDILTSGALLLAMSFGKACIAPKLGCIPDYLDHRGAFLYDAADDKGLACALGQALTAAGKLAEMGVCNRQRAEECSWKRSAAETLEVYRGGSPQSPIHTNGEGQRVSSTPIPTSLRNRD